MSLCRVDNRLHVAHVGVQVPIATAPGVVRAHFDCPELDVAGVFQVFVQVFHDLGAVDAANAAAQHGGRVFRELCMNELRRGGIGILLLDSHLADACSHKEPGVGAAIAHVEGFDFKNLAHIAFACELEPGFACKVDGYTACHHGVVLDGGGHFPVTVSAVGGIRRGQNLEIRESDACVSAIAREVGRPGAIAERFPVDQQFGRTFAHVQRDFLGAATLPVGQVTVRQIICRCGSCMSRQTARNQFVRGNPIRGAHSA